MNRLRLLRFLRGAGQSGQGASVDAAMAFIVILLVFVGILQGGLYLVGLNSVTNAARQGARVGSVVQECAACAASGAAQAEANRSPILKSVSVSVLAPGGVTGADLTIRVTGNIPLVVPLGGMIPGINNILEVSGEATFRQEGW